MLRIIKQGIYNRNILIGRPNLTLKNFQCQNITCNKADRFKKYKDGIFLCECGYMAFGDFEIEKTHKIKFGCSSDRCPENKSKMDKNCLSCNHVYEK